MIKGFVIAAYSTANMDWVFIALFLTLFNGIFGFIKKLLKNTCQSGQKMSQEHKQNVMN